MSTEQLILVPHLFLIGGINLQALSSFEEHGIMIQDFGDDEPVWGLIQSIHVWTHQALQHGSSACTLELNSFCNLQSQIECVAVSEWGRFFVMLS